VHRLRNSFLAQFEAWCTTRSPGQFPIAKCFSKKASDYLHKTQTDANGEFHFDAVPLGEYAVSVSNAGFASEAQSVTVLSGAAPVLHSLNHLNVC
jgi:Carboxypeptidase regulatory-like domain